MSGLRRARCTETGRPRRWPPLPLSRPRSGLVQYQMGTAAPGPCDCLGLALEVAEGLAWGCGYFSHETNLGWCLSVLGEVQCTPTPASRLENPMDGGAW